MSSDKSPRITILERIRTWIDFLWQWLTDPNRGFKWLKKTSWFAGIGFAIFLIVWISCRGLLLNWAFNKAVVKLEKKGYSLTCKEKGFTWLFGVHLKGLALNYNQQIPTPNDTLPLAQQSIYKSLPNAPVFACDDLAIGLNVWKFWNIGLSGFETEQLSLNLVNLPDYCNYCGLMGSDNQPEENTKPNKDPIVSLFRQLESYIGKAPNHLEMRQTQMALTDTTGTFSLQLPNTLFKHKELSMQLLATSQKITTEKEKKEYRRRRKSDADTLPATTTKSVQFVLQGDIDKDDLTGHVSITPSKNQKFVSIPLVLNGLGFQKADFEVNELGESFGAIHADLRGGFVGLQVNDERISDTLVQVDSANGRFVCDIKDGFFELDSQSSVQINHINANIFAQYQGGNNPKYAFNVYMPRLRANDFFASLPVGLFRNIGIPQATGTLEYRFQFAIEHEKPKDCILESKMWPSKDFTIVKWGNVDPRIMNGEFTYTYWEKGDVVARFQVGESNGNFTRIDNISPDLTRCVMRSEDPDFYHHQGFYMDAFRSSIAQNYKQKRFARGGSTISMQLVKNVFLGRRKTIARKVEEILLTWLMERRALVSKSRLLEVYLNVIEWGPGVFGVTEASRFYFHKNPIDLNLGECTFLASIIPMPKKVRWFLDSNGCVRENNGHFSALRRRLLAKDSGTIDTAIFKVCIHPDAWARLKGPAQKRETTEIPDEVSEEGELPLEAIEQDEHD